MFGDLLREVREARRWTQGELARTLGVEQQTVSRWERDLSRPRASLVPRLAEVLGVPTEQIASALGYFPSAESQGRRRPTRALTGSLPLLELTPERFEGFCKDLFRFLRGTPHVHRYGGPGHAQRGIDLLVKHSDGTTEVVQCKRHRRFGPANVREVVQATDFDADRYVLLLARDHASPDARDEVRNHPGWTLWDADDVADVVRNDLNPADAVRLVDTYFPGWREDFLGVPNPGPWLDADEYFGPMSSSAIYSHDRPLVGREHVLRKVSRWALSDEASPVGILVGRGGIGKTRLLRELANYLNEVPGHVRFLATGMDVSPEALENLPETGVVLVVDDAHDRSDLSSILHGVLRQRPEARVLFALRPYGVPGLDPALRSVGLRRADLPTWELEDLTSKEAELLVREIAGESPFARPLALRTRDCPLVTVLGAELLRRGSLDPARLEGAEDLRSEVLGLFRTVLTEDGATGSNRIRQSLLDLIALVQPFRTDLEEFRNLLSTAAGTTWDRAVRELRDLEAAGVLLRRGKSLRIVPDLLGDAILADAAFDPLGDSTGFVERIFAGGTVGDLPRQHAFLNTIRVDWQVKDRPSGDSGPRHLLWQVIQHEFESAGVRGRRQLLDLVARVSAFAPKEALALSLWAVKNPTNIVDDVDSPYLGFSSDPVDYQEVLWKLPSVLRGVAYSLDYLAEVCDLLWRLAISDSRPTNQHPEHPIRVLQDLAEFQQGKTSTYNAVVLTRAAEWLKHGPWSTFHSPFDVLETLLATEGAEARWTGKSISFHPFGLRVKAVQPLREQVVSLAIQELRNDRLGRATRAAETLGQALAGPTGLYGRAVSDDERQRWDDVFLETLEAIRQGLVDHDLDPVVWAAVNDALSWHLTWAEGPTRDAAYRVAALAPDSLERRLTEALLDSWGERFRQAEESYELVEARLQAENEELATSLVSARTPEEAVDLIEDRLRAISLAFPSKISEAGRFTWTLCQQSSEVASAICRQVHEDPTSPCTTVLAAALGALAERGESHAISLARWLLGVGTVDVTRQVAHSFGWGRGSRPELLDGELELLHVLAVNEDAVVRRSVARAAQVIGRTSPGKAQDLLLSISFDDSEEVADEVLGSLGRGDPLSWAGLDFKQRRRLLTAAESLSSIDSYRILQALAELSSIHPQEALGLLLARAERMELMGESQYSPIPLHHNPSLKIRSHAEFATYLRQVLVWVADARHSGWRDLLGPRIFWAVALECDEEVERLLIESVEEGTDAMVRAVGVILWGAPREWVFGASHTVETLLTSAAAHGREAVQSIQSGLYAAVISGSRVGAVGHPFREDVEQEHRALSIAESLPPGSPAQEFYRALSAEARASIESSLQRDGRLMDGRDW